jgi:hypothetical protein
MRKLIIVGLIGLSASLAIAQTNTVDSSKMLQIDLKYDKPSRNFLNIGVLGAVNSNFNQVSSGVGAAARFDLGKIANFSAKFLTEIPSFRVDTKLKNLADQSSYVPFRSVQLRGSIHFDVKDEVVSVYIELGRTSSKEFSRTDVITTTNTYSVNAPVTHRNSKSFTFSVSNENVTFGTDKKDSTLPMNFELYKNGVQASNFVPSFIGFQNLTIISAGIGQTTKAFYKARFTSNSNAAIGSKVKRYNTSLELSIEALYGLVTGVKDRGVSQDENGNLTEYEVRNAEIQKWGMRLQVLGQIKKPGLAATFSIGSRPGVKNPVAGSVKWAGNLFAELGLGLGF